MFSEAECLLLQFCARRAEAKADAPQKWYSLPSAGIAGVKGFVSAAV